MPPAKFLSLKTGRGKDGRYMSETKESMDNASKMLHDVMDTSQEAASLVIQMLTGLFPSRNVKKINDAIGIHYNEEGEPITANDDIKGIDVPHVMITPLLGKLDRDEIPYVIAQPDDSARLTGMTHLKLLGSTESQVDELIQEASEEDNSKYFVDSQIPGKLVSVAGDGQDHEVLTVCAIKDTSVWDISKELQEMHVYHSVSAGADGMCISVLSVDEDKLLEAYKNAGLEKYMPEYSVIAEAEQKKVLAMKAAQSIADGNDPVTGKHGIKPVVIYDATDPAHRIITTTGGSKEMIGKKEIDAISPLNTDYAKRLQIKTDKMVMPIVAYEKDYKELINGYEDRMREYDDRVNAMRATLDNDRKALRAYEGQLSNILNKETKLEEELEQDIREGREDRYNTPERREAVEREDLELGRRYKSITLAVAAAEALKLLDNHELEAMRDLNNARVALGEQVNARSMEIEQRIKDLEMPELGKENEKAQEVYDAKFIRDMRKGNEYKSVEIHFGGEEGERMEMTLNADELYFSEYSNQVEAKAQLEQACSELQKEISELTVTRNIEMPMRGDEELSQETQVLEAETKVTALEAEVGDTGAPEEPVISGDFE